jgi:hypothetical protein
MFSNLRPRKFFQNWDFWFENKPSGNPCPNEKMIPNNHKMYQMITRYTKWLSDVLNGNEIYQHFSFQGPPKHTKIGIFGYENKPSGSPDDHCRERR